MRFNWVAPLLLGFVASNAASQDLARLRSTKTFRCVFTVTAHVNMDTDVPRVKTSADGFELIFDQVDLKKGTARLIGNAGSEDVTVFSGSESITFIERTGTGNLQVTAIYMAQERDRRFKAVHSRHTAILGGIPIASQMYGACLALT